MEAIGEEKIVYELRTADGRLRATVCYLAMAEAIAARNDPAVGPLTIHPIPERNARCFPQT